MADTKAQQHAVHVPVVTNVPHGQAHYVRPLTASQQTGLVRARMAGSCACALMMFGAFFTVSGAVMTGMGYQYTEPPFGPPIEGPRALRTIGPIFLSIGLCMILSAIIMCIFVAHKARKNGTTFNVMNSTGINTGFSTGGPVVAGGTAIIHSGPVGGAMHYYPGTHHTGIHDDGCFDHGTSDHTGYYNCGNTGFSDGGGFSSGGGAFSSGGGGFSSDGGGFSSGGGDVSSGGGGFSSGGGGFD